MIKNTLYIASGLIFILLVSGSPIIYDHYQQMQFDKNRLREIKGKLRIFQNNDSQNDQIRSTNMKNGNIKEDSLTISIDDQLRKEEKHYVIQKGANLPKIGSTSKLIIRELKIINKISSKEAVFGNPTFN